MLPQLKLAVKDNYNITSFKEIFFIAGSELSNSVKTFLVLHIISLLFLYKKYRVRQVPRFVDPKFSNTDFSETQP